MNVSVVMPLGNADRFVAQAIESILVQTHHDFELLIVDDGSTDGSADIARKYARSDRRIRILGGTKLGISEALNLGVREASHEWIVRMDADDIMLPNRIERQMEFVSRNPEIAVASSFVQHIDSEGRIIGIGTSHLLTSEAVQKALDGCELIGFHHPGVICRRSVIQEVGGYRQVFPEDIDLWHRIAEEGYTILVQPEFLLQYRIHRSSLSHQSIVATVRQLRWIQECSFRRRQGLPEMTMEEFARFEAERPLRRKVREWCADQGLVMYKRAVVSYAERDYFPMVACLAAACLASPLYVLNQILTKYPSFQRYIGAKCLHASVETPPVRS